MIGLPRIESYATPASPASHRVAHPIRRGFALRLVFMVAAICAAVGFVSYRSHYEDGCLEFERYLKGILQVTVSKIDADDLENCIRTGSISPAYEELQHYIDGLVDTLDVLYIYAIVPLNETGVDSAKSVIASFSSEEYAAGEYHPVLNVLSGTDCPADVAVNNMKAFQGEGVLSFITVSVWGTQYTSAIPLFNSRGERFALLCADIQFDEIRSNAWRYTLITIFSIVFISLLAGYMFYRWAFRNIIDPVRNLETEAHEFASVCDSKKDPESLVFREPVIRTENEIASLSHEISHMAAAMRSYVNSIHDAEDRTLSMTLLAYRDSLTGVRNATAYEEERRRLEEAIAQSTAQFALVVMDINGLKTINDTYGHEFGDEYIIGACRVFCDVFVHSSVFRIGGDEFIAVLEDRDYSYRDALFEMLQSAFARASSDTSKSPWRRYDAAAGMSEYRTGDTLKDVFHRADEEMYKNKSEKKNPTGFVSGMA